MGKSGLTAFRASSEINAHSWRKNFVCQLGPKWMHSVLCNLFENDTDRQKIKSNRAVIAAGVLRQTQKITLTGLFIGFFLIGLTSLARAEKIENDIAVFSALNKVTARISHLEVKLNDTIKFGALKITPRACLSRPVTEKPWTSAFIEVDETKLSGQEQRIFSGWMFAQSPGLHAVEHPVFDVWLVKCRKSSGAQIGGGRTAQRADETKANEDAASQAGSAEEGQTGQQAKPNPRKRSPRRRRSMDDDFFQ